tara:strand:+ start:176 stop:427 length:252 start_codon:yes stop_codon:yes gene_type:complete
METVRDYILKRFTEMGMSEEQVNHVIEYCKENCETDIDFNAQRYEGFLMSILFTTVKTYALEWISKNIPQAWFKPMFETPKNA